MSFSVFLLTCYPLVPTLTFLTVMLKKGLSPDPNVAGQIIVPGENDYTTIKKIKRKHTNLVQWARMSPIIEGGIEAPLQMILQVIIIIYNK